MTAMAATISQISWRAAIFGEQAGADAAAMKAAEPHSRTGP